MPQLGRFLHTVRNTAGTAISGSSVAIYREGATVNGNQSGTSPFAVTVRHAGKIATGDDVFVNAASGTTYSATRTSSTVITLAGFVGTLNLTSGDRLTPSGSQPTLYSDDQAGASTANPLTSSSTGVASCWMEYGAYEVIVSGGGATTTLFQALVTPTESPGQVRYAESFPGANAGEKIAAALVDLPSDGGVVDARALAGSTASPGEITSDPFSGITQPFVLLLGVGKYRTTVNMRLSNNGQQIWGAGRNATEILAHASSFPVSTAVISNGKTTGTFGSLVKDLTVNCNNVAGSIGFLLDGAQEGSGCIRTQASNAKDAGYRLNSALAAASTQQVRLEDVDGGVTDAAGVVIDVESSTGGQWSIERASIGGVGVTATAGIRAAASGGHMTVIHVENATDGILCTAGGQFIFNVTGHSSVTDLIDIRSQAVMCVNVFGNSATNTINDTGIVPNNVLTNSRVEFYNVGEDSGRQTISSESNVPMVINAPMRTVAVVFANADTTPSVSGGLLFKTNNGGATSITDFDDAKTGQWFRLIFGDANTTIVHGAGVIGLRGAANYTGATGDIIEFQDDGGVWRECNRSPA